MDGSNKMCRCRSRCAHWYCTVPPAAAQNRHHCSCIFQLRQLLSLPRSLPLILQRRQGAKTG